MGMLTLLAARSAMHEARRARRAVVAMRSDGDPDEEARMHVIMFATVCVVLALWPLLLALISPKPTTFAAIIAAGLMTWPAWALGGPWLGVAVYTASAIGAVLALLLDALRDGQQPSPPHTDERNHR